MYQPMVMGAGTMRFADPKAGMDVTEEGIPDDSIIGEAVPVTWEKAIEVDIDVEELERSPEEGAGYGELPEAARQAKSYEGWSREFAMALREPSARAVAKSRIQGVFRARRGGARLPDSPAGDRPRTARPVGGRAAEEVRRRWPTWKNACVAPSRPRREKRNRSCTRGSRRRSRSALRCWARS